MAIIKMFLLCFLLSAPKLWGAEVTFREFGAVGNGINDDSKAFETAIIYAAKNNMTINGENLTYLVTGKRDMKPNYFSIKNANFVTSKSYAQQFALKITCNIGKLLNVSFDGGRNTYKSDPEEWKDFSRENGVTSIYPASDDLFYFVSLDKTAVFSFNNLTFKNIHAASCFTVVTYGVVNIDRLSFTNISNKTFHIYHSPNEGVTQFGKTIVGTVYSKDVGLLPEKLLYNKKVILNKDLQSMPQASFNFIVSFGEYYLSRADVENYGSTGVTSDRNTVFQADYINVRNNSNKALSNNPSAAVWFEASKVIKVKRVDINIQKRDQRDANFDSSALALYGVDTTARIDTLNIVGNQLNKGLRGSFEGLNKIDFGIVNISGNYKQATGLLSTMPSSKINTQIDIEKLNQDSGIIEFYGIKEVIINQLNGQTGRERINFKLPYSLNGVENYEIKSSNIIDIYKSDIVRKTNFLDMNHKLIRAKQLNN